MTKPRPYLFNPDPKVWVTLAHDGISYSDGDAVEHRLLKVLQDCLDVSAASEELRAHITDWPSEYHLSPARHNLLRPFTFGPSDRILELGCGCGAITRYLGESGATVVAVEGSHRRAMIAAERCRDLPNVSVYCDNLVDFQADGPFDIVMLIGVLEYSPMYVSGSDPAGSVIETACRHLGPDGKLIVAIENQLGLKYLSGCAEDHTNVPFFGVHDLYGPHTPVTFGKKELTSKLHSAGLINTRFYYPFPDYKVPEVVLADTALDQENFRPADLLHRLTSRDYGNMPWRAFHESLAWGGVARNGLLGDLANSFIVVASASPRSSRTKWLAYVFSARRLPIFATETVFLEEDGGILVTKNPLYPNSPYPQEARFRHHPPPRANYVVGELYAIELQRIMARAGNLDEVARWVSTWVAHLVQRADINHCHLLPGDCLDVIPANLVRTPTGALVEIDSEWSSTGQIPLSWILIRGLVNALSSSPPSPVFSKMSYCEAVAMVFDRLDHTLSDRDFQEAAALEDELQRVVNGSGWKGPCFDEILSRPARSFTFAPTFGDRLIAKQMDLDHAHSEIARVKSTVSWQITMPLRVVWNTMSRLLRSGPPSP